MIQVLVERLKEGQVLAKDVVRDDGVVLVGAGQLVSADLIALLTRLDVESVAVEGDEFASEEERQAHLRKMEQALDERFSRVSDDKLLMAVKEMFKKRLAAGCGTGQESGDQVVGAVRTMMGQRNDGGPGS